MLDGVLGCVGVAVTEVPVLGDAELVPVEEGVSDGDVIMMDVMTSAIGYEYTGLIVPMPSCGVAHQSTWIIMMFDYSTAHRKRITAAKLVSFPTR